MNKEDVLYNMLPLKQRLQKIQKKKKANWEIVELDYVLSWVLAAIGHDLEIREFLIFKGGTCLKKCYFGENYRYSQDLDFTAAKEVSDLKLDEYINKVAETTMELTMQVRNPIQVVVDPYKEKEPHPFNQRAYILRAKLPWHREPLTK